MTNQFVYSIHRLCNAVWSYAESLGFRSKNTGAAARKGSLTGTIPRLQKPVSKHVAQ